MNNRNYIAAALGLAVLILDAQAAAASAREGITLCLQTVIPSLFPFFVCSVLLTGNVSISGTPLIKSLASLFRIPLGCEGILLTAFLGGYPIGAQSVADAWKQGRITKKQAGRMLSFCNQPGPAFLFGMVGQQFSQWYMPWIIWGILLISAWVVSLVFQPDAEGSRKSGESTSVSLSAAMDKAIWAMAKVCGWVILFRIFLGAAQRWILWMFPEEVQIFLAGLLELANGCCMLSSIRDEAVRFILACAVLSFGGVCVVMQTQSVIQGLELKPYLLGKLLQTAVAVGVSAFLVMRPGIHWVLLFMALFIAAGVILCSGRKILKIKKNSVAFSGKI